MICQEKKISYYIFIITFYISDEESATYSNLMLLRPSVCPAIWCYWCVSSPLERIWSPINQSTIFRLREMPLSASYFSVDEFWRILNNFPPLMSRGGSVHVHRNKTDNLVLIPEHCFIKREVLRHQPFSRREAGQHSANTSL